MEIVVLCFQYLCREIFNLLNIKIAEYYISSVINKQPPVPCDPAHTWKQPKCDTFPILPLSRYTQHQLIQYAVCIFFFPFLFFSSNP